MGEGENILFWAVSGSGIGFPQSEAAFNKIMRRSGKPRAAYFGCSTMRLDDAGDLFNRQSQFGAYYVLIFDDIGTGPGAKIAPGDLPAGMPKPTFIVETSLNNFQYGYVFEVPIGDLEIAKAFQREMIERAGVDPGGMMPNKAVRLPCGFNLKDERKNPDGSPFECRLVLLDPDRLYTPQELLKGVGSGLSWADIEKRAVSGGGSRRMGTTAHRAAPVYRATLDGIVDPVLEWLNTEGLIVSEGRGDWIDIVCPWAEEHTGGPGRRDKSTGYSPVGMGDYPEQRSFKCLHGHCEGRRTGEFLIWVLEQGGPRSSPKSVIEDMISRFVLDPETDRITNLKTEDLEPFSTKGFKSEHSTSVMVPDTNGKMKAVSEMILFINDPNRLRIEGTSYVTGGEGFIPSTTGGRVRLNTWRGPEWGDGDFDQSLVDPFIEFMHYLKPQGDDAERWLDHLAAKAQNPRYRGPATIEHTPVQGIGRGMQERIITGIFGASNVASIELGDLLSEGFNSGWLMSDFVFIAEAKDGRLSPRQEFKAYESLKKMIEPHPVRMLYKMKKIPDRMIETCFTLVVSSQHADALPSDSGDTRFWRIENPVTKWGAEKYKFLDEVWLPSKPFGDVWRWLRQREFDTSKLFARRAVQSLAEITAESIERKEGIDPAIGLCVLFAEQELGGAVFVDKFVAGIQKVEDALGLNYEWEKRFRRELVTKTRMVRRANKDYWSLKIDGRMVKIRATVEPTGRAIFDSVLAGNSGNMARFSRAIREGAEDTQGDIPSRLVEFIRTFIYNQDSGL